MKITIRTLKHEEYQFDCEPTDTILSLKKQITEKLQHETDWQTLIYSGTVLTNDRTIESCKILEKGFMVLMVKKPRVVAAAPAPVEQKAPTTPAVVPTPATPVATTPATPVTPVTAPTAPGTAPGAPARAQGAPAGPGATGPELEEMVTRIMEMGFPRDDVLRALEAGWHNPDRAVEFLMMGNIPPRGAAGGMAVPPMAGAGDFDIGEDDSEDEQGGGNPFDLLKNTPQFQQLRLLAQQSPQLLEQVLHQLPPELINVINQNQEEFIRLLNEPIVAPAGGAAPQAVGGVRQRGGAPPPGTVQIRVSPEDEAVINNLVDMTGVSKDQVIRAYALFEKDAEMTANYLLNHGHDEDAAGFGGGFGGGGFGGDFGGFGGQ